MAAAPVIATEGLLARLGLGMKDVFNLGSGLMSLVPLKEKAHQVHHSEVPSAPDDLRKKYRWLQPTIKNETEFDIFFDGTYFSSGRYYRGPQTIAPFTASHFSACNQDGSILTGATGGAAFHIQLDKNHRYDFAIGWQNPTLGSFYAGVAHTYMGDDDDKTHEKNAQNGYNAATTTGGSIQSGEIYYGKTEDGEEVAFRLHISVSPGQYPVYVVKQSFLD